MAWKIPKKTDWWQSPNEGYNIMFWPMVSHFVKAFLDIHHVWDFPFETTFFWGWSIAMFDYRSVWSTIPQAWTAQSPARCDRVARQPWTRRAINGREKFCVETPPSCFFVSSFGGSQTILGSIILNPDVGQQSHFCRSNHVKSIILCVFPNSATMFSKKSPQTYT